MIGKGVGILALAAVLGFVSYYETSLLQSKRLSAISTDSRALLAQAPTATGGVRTLCKGGETLTITVSAKGVTSVPACNLPTNTCLVILNAPDRNPAKVNYCCNPEDGVCQCKTTSLPCDKTHPMKSSIAQTISPYKYKCTLSSTKSGMVSPASQAAAVTSAASSDSDTINCAELDKRLASAQQPAGGAAPGYTPPAAVPPPATVAPVKTPAAPAATVPASRDAIAPAYQPSVAEQQPARSGSFDANREIQRIGGSGNTGSTGSTGSTGALPGQPQQAAPGGPAFAQGGVYRPGTTPGASPVAGGTRPGFFSPSRAQNTFGGTGFSGSRSSGRIAGSFISGIASLIGGLFSVPTNNVVNYVQSFVGGSSPQQQTPANQNGGQQRNTNAPGQVVIVVPYPMPTSRNTIGTQLPPRPTSTSDSYAELRELARQAGETTGAAAPTGTQEDRITSAFTGQAEEKRPGTVPGGNQNANGQSGAISAAGKQGGLSPSAGQTGTTSVSSARATSTHATSTSYKEPKVVEIGIPVDITDLGSYETVLAYLRGDWARTEHTALQNKVALAQAEVQQDAIRAQLEALQDARAAGLCDDSCATSLTVLQNELPVLQSRVEALQTAVEKDAQPRPSSPPPTVAQINRVVESLAEPTYEAAIPRSGADAPTAVSVAEQEALPEVPQTKSEAIVTRVVQSVWNFLKSIFLPPATETAKPRPSCSLFASLFGKCK